MRWVLGDGKTINITTDRWLKDKEDFCVNQVSTTVGLNSKVCEFFKNDRKMCDEVKVRIHFSTNDANDILNTRIPYVCTKYMIAWIHSSNGQYTVKMGYQQWHKTMLVM